MNYGSFYGGRKGTSFVIVKSYPDIISMVQDFIKGPDFSEVKYDEYVLINTYNKTHPDNGKIFRRGRDYNSNREISGRRAYRDAAHTDEIKGKTATIEDYQTAYYSEEIDIIAGGAQYIGTIVGPPGRAPHLSMLSYDEVRDRQAQQGYSTIRNSGSFSLPAGDLLPGKYVENDVIKYNDEIKWCSVSVRNPNNDTSDAFIGFQIPYPVIDFVTEKVSSYNEQGEVIDSSKAERVDTGEYHPFYEKWKLSIPQGVKGDALKKLRIIRFEDLPNTKIFINQQNYYYYDSEQERFFYGTEGGETQDTAVETTDDKFSFQIGNLTYTIQPNTQIMVYDLYNYEERKDPQDPEKIYFVGILNQIMQDTFDIADNGDIHIDFTDGTALDKKGYMKKIDNIQIGPETDDDDVVRTKMKIYFNTQIQDSQGNINKQVVSYVLKLIDDIQIRDNGTIKISYTDGDVLQKTEYMKTIKNIRFENDQLIITLNTNEEISHDMAWVSNFEIDPDGKVYLKRNGNSTRDTDSIQTIKWIDNIAYNKDQNATIITYNDGSQTRFENIFRSISNAYIDATSNQFVIVYTTTDAQGNPESNTFQLAGSLIRGVTYENGEFVVQYTGKNDDRFSVNYPAKVVFNNSNPASDDCLLEIDALNNDRIFKSNSPIDSVYDMQITSDHHLVVLFTSTLTRDKIRTAGKTYSNGAALVSPRDGKSYSNWLDLGSVFTDSGILIGLNLNNTDFDMSVEQFSQLTVSEIITRLNDLYASGLDGDDHLNGKIITVGIPGEKKEFYAFDYNKDSQNNYKGWYFLGSIESAARGEQDCKMGTQNEMSSYLSSVAEDGLFFIIEG